MGNVLLKKQLKNEKKCFNRKDLIGTSKKAWVKRIIDGDTVEVVIYIKKSKNIIERIRLFNVDTPELKPRKNICDRELHIKAALKAKDVVHNLLFDKIVIVEIISIGKFGRIVAKIKTKTFDLSSFLLENKLALEYSGKNKRETFTKKNLETIIKF